MKTFDLPESSRLKLLKATPRKETHGKELVQAISLRVEWWPTDNALLNLVHERLQDALFWTPPEVAQQCELDGVPPVKKHRRLPNLSTPLKLEQAFSGYSVTIDHGIDSSTALELYAVGLDKFEAEAKEGGSCVIRWSMASNKEVTPELVGQLCALEGATVVATLLPPTPGQEPIDGTTEAFKRDHPGAGAGGQDQGPDLFAEGQADRATDAFLGIHGSETDASAGGPPDSDTDAGADDDDDGSEGGTTDAEARGRTELPRTVKYRHPSTGETWSGRGNQPRWIKAALAAGRALDEFAIEPVQA